MQRGTLKGDARRSDVYWEADDRKLSLIDRMAGAGAVDAEYTLRKFRIRSEYCAACRKMIIDTDVKKCKEA